MMPLKEKKIMKESICNKNQMQNWSIERETIIWL